MKRGRGKYKAGGTPAGIKDYRAEFVFRLLECGVEWEKIMEASNLTKYAVGKSTLERHVARARKGEPVVSQEKHSGRAPILTPAEWDIVAGAILLEKNKVDSVWVRKFVNDYFGKDLGESTISDHIRELDLSYGLAKRKKRQRGVDFSDEVKAYYDFVSGLHKDGFFMGDPGRTLLLGLLHKFAPS